MRLRDRARGQGPGPHRVTSCTWRAGRAVKAVGPGVWAVGEDSQGGPARPSLPSLLPGLPSQTFISTNLIKRVITGMSQMSELNSTHLCKKWLRERRRPARRSEGRCVSQTLGSVVSLRASQQRGHRQPTRRDPGVPRRARGRARCGPARQWRTGRCPDS